MKQITRRSAIGGGIALSASLSYADAQTKATAFALIGDRYHNSDYIRTGLTRTITKDLDLSIDFCDETKRLTADTLSGYKLLIILRDGMIWPDGYPEGGRSGGGQAVTPTIVSDPPLPPRTAKAEFWMKPEQGKAVRQFVDNGGSALFLHNVTHVGLTNPDFRHVLGASYSGHPAIRPFKVKVKNHDHPITKGVHDFVVTDEQHYMEYDKDSKYLLLETVNEDGLTYNDLGSSAPGGWAYDYGKGRVCYFSPGHLLTSLWNPEYIKLQHNAVRWLLREG
jgi:type 1 glutamine amidotransferase